MNVPNVPGVPAVLFAPQANQSADPFANLLLTADTYTYFGSVFGEQWGLFANGSPVVTCDNVCAFEYKQEWLVSDYPVERGAFESYDKVQTPFSVRLRFTAGGSTANRTSLLASISAVAGTLTLFDAATPEAVYPNVNVTHYDYRRSAEGGLGLMIVDVWCEEIRQAGGGTGVGGILSDASPQSASATPAVNGGTVQPQAPTVNQSALSSFFN